MSIKLSEKGQAYNRSKLYYGKMTEQRDNQFMNFAQDRVGSIPAPTAEGVDGAGKTIFPPQIEDRVAKLTASRMLEIINRMQDVNVGMFQTKAEES